MHDMAGAETADAQMGIIGKDRTPGRAARCRNRPGVAAHGKAAGMALFGVQLGQLERPEWLWPGRWRQKAQIGLGDRGYIKTIWNPEVPRRAQRRHQPISFKQPQRCQSGPSHFIVSITSLDTTCPRQVAHVPSQRPDAQRRIFKRQLCRVGFQLGDSGVHAGDIAFRTVQHAIGHRRQLGIDIAAILTQPRRRIGRHERCAESLRHSALVAAILQVDLEQPVPRNQIALPEKGVVQRLRPDMWDAKRILDDFDWRAGPGNTDPGPAAGNGLRLRSQSPRHGKRSNRCQQKRSSLDHQPPIARAIVSR